MQTYNFAELQTVNGKLSFQDRLQGMLKFGFSWPNDVLAQDEFTRLLQKDVDQRSTLIRGFTLPDVEMTIPFILVGPPGVRVILTTRERGMFRAKEEQWLIHTGKGFRPAKDNLIHRTQQFVKATRKFLDDRGFDFVTIEGLIVGLNPGMHIDTHQPAVRVIQSDAIRRFGSQWDQKQSEISHEYVYQIISSITRTGIMEVDVDDSDELSEPNIDKFTQSLEPLHKTFSFSSKQWAIVIVMIAATVCVLLIFMVFIILSL
jgi:hypothetical protein